MKLRCILIDDEFHAVANLERLIHQHCPMLEICGTAYTLPEATALATTAQPDLVFLDIKMPGGNTIDLIDPAIFTSTLVIFVTAYDEFALRAIKLGALDYILKPVDPSELVLAAGRALAHFTTFSPGSRQQYEASIADTLKQAGSRRERDTLGVYVNSEYCLLQYQHIMAFEAVGAYTRIHTHNHKVYTVSKNIGHFEDLLNKDIFYRVHKSFIVNISGISAIDRGLRTIKMNNNLTVPVSQRAMPQFINRFNR